MRGKLARIKARNIRENKAAVVLQKQARVFLARLRLLFLKKEKVVVRLQSVWRMKQAKEQLRMLRLKREN